MAEELKERKAFEAHMRVGGHSNHDKHPDGSYVSSAMELWWQGWKARAKLPSQVGEAVEVVASIAVDAEGVVRDFTLEPGLDRHPGGYTVTPLMTVAQHQRILASSVGSGDPVAWHTEDHLTTYDPEIAKRWRAKGWPITPLYTHPADQVADDLTMVKVSRELLQDLRDLAFDQVEHHRAAMGAYKQTRQSAMDSALAQADALLEVKP